MKILSNAGKSNQDINIKITLTDQVTKNLKTVSGNMRDFSRQMKETGRNLSQVGMAMTAVGASITAPLLVAYKQAGKFNAEIAHQLRQTQNVFDNLSLSIGKSLLPVMRQLTDVVSNAVTWWNNLEQATRDKIVQNFIKLGVALTTMGIALMVVGNALKFLSNLAVLSSALLAMNPVVLAVGASFTVLAVAMWKCKIIGDIVIDTLQAIPRAMAGIMGMSKVDSERILGKGGEWRAKFNEFKAMFDDLGKTWTDFTNNLNSGNKSENKESAGNFFEGFKSQIDLAGEALKDFQKIGIDVANNMTTAMSGMFTSFFDDAFQGNLRKGKDYFLSFANSIAKIFTDLLSQMITQWIAVNVVMKGADAIGTWLGIGTKALSLGGGSSTIVGGVGGTTTNTAQFGTVWSPYHSGGIIRAHNGLAVDEVPIIAQSGERVLSRSQNRDYENGRNGNNSPAVVVIQAWDTQDIMRNRKSIEGIIMNALKNNSGLRGAVKTYG
jgi:hypothetical protein